MYEYERVARSSPTEIHDCALTGVGFCLRKCKLRVLPSLRPLRDWNY